MSFHGVRGSIPAPGPETNRYGGNTSCVSVRAGAEGALFVLDAGTGAIALGRELMRGAFGRGEGEVALLLTHAHWDHIQGFPFFGPIFVPGNRIDIFGPGPSAALLEGILEGQMNPNFSPLHTMKNLGATFSYFAVPTAPTGILAAPAPFVLHRGVRIRAHENPHGASTALAYRLEAPAFGDSSTSPPGVSAAPRPRVLVYAPDAGYDAASIPEAAIEFYRGADVLIHDATYTPEDRRGREARGSSSVEEAVTAAVRAGVPHLVLTHYDQDYSDEMVDAQLERARRLLDDLGAHSTKVSAASEGDSLVV